MMCPTQLLHAVVRAGPDVVLLALTDLLGEERVYAMSAGSARRLAAAVTLGAAKAEAADAACPLGRDGGGP
jgi:hypothetical protein